jgi:hypothetical protein
MTEHGKIHTDGSRSGGQPVNNDKDSALPLPCPDCGAKASHGDNAYGSGYFVVCSQDCLISPSVEMSDKAAAIATWNTLQPTQSDCDSCGGLNTSCPDGCERDPATGELLFMKELPNDGRNAAILAKIERYTQKHTATPELAQEAIERATMTDDKDSAVPLPCPDCSAKASHGDNAYGSGFFARWFK